jgi:hypothetical protein
VVLKRQLSNIKSGNFAIKQFARLASATTDPLSSQRKLRRSLTQGSSLAGPAGAGTGASATPWGDTSSLGAATPPAPSPSPSGPPKLTRHLWERALRAALKHARRVAAEAAAARAAALPPRDSAAAGRDQSSARGQQKPQGWQPCHSPPANPAWPAPWPPPCTVRTAPGALLAGPMALFGCRFQSPGCAARPRPQLISKGRCCRSAVRPKPGTQEAAGVRKDDRGADQDDEVGGGRRAAGGKRQALLSHACHPFACCMQLLQGGRWAEEISAVAPSCWWCWQQQANAVQATAFGWAAGPGAVLAAAKASCCHSAHGRCSAHTRPAYPRRCPAVQSSTVWFSRHNFASTTLLLHCCRPEQMRYPNQWLQEGFVLLGRLIWPGAITQQEFSLLRSGLDVPQPAPQPDAPTVGVAGVSGAQRIPSTCLSDWLWRPQEAAPALSCRAGPPSISPTKSM